MCFSLNYKTLFVWQSSRPASFSPAGLTLWPSWLERWLATLSGLSVQVRIPVGLPGHYIGGSSAGLGKVQRIDSSLRADWLSCFSLAWWEWRVARQGCLVPLRKGGMWQSSRPASFSPAGLTLWPSWLERWLATLSGLSVQARIPVGLPGHYICIHPAVISSSGQTILLNDRSDRSKALRSIIDRKANLRSIICRSFIIVKWTGLLLWKQYIIITVRFGIWDSSHLL